MWKVIILKFIKHKPMHYTWPESSFLNFHLRHKNFPNNTFANAKYDFPHILQIESKRK